MKYLSAILALSALLTACGGPSGTADPDACTCAKEIHAQGPTAPVYARCQEKINSDPVFKDDFSKCTAAEIMHRDTAGMRTEPGAISIQSDGAYRLAEGKDSITWIGQKINGKSESGTVRAVSASLEAAGGVVSGGEIVIDMKSIAVSGIEDPAMRDKLTQHLRSDDFFGVEKYPQARFVITSVEKTGNAQLVKGDLTLKGKTHEALGSLSITGSGSSTVIIQGAIQFDRSKFDVRYGSGSFFENLGNDLILDQVQLTYKLTLVK